jgi:hypothetical protein
VFTNIDEPEVESDADCVRTLRHFMTQRLGLSPDTVNGIMLQRTHRLGRKRRGVAPNGRPWGPRPIIACFRDFPTRQHIRSKGKLLKGTKHYIHEDLPLEIRSARGQLWDEYSRARADKLKASIVFPAKLVVEGHVVRDLFPNWGWWSIAPGRRQARTPPDDDRPLHHEGALAASGRPHDMRSLADYVEAQPFQPGRSSHPVTTSPQKEAIPSSPSPQSAPRPSTSHQPIPPPPPVPNANGVPPPGDSPAPLFEGSPYHHLMLTSRDLNCMEAMTYYHL